MISPEEAANADKIGIVTLSFAGGFFAFIILLDILTLGKDVDLLRYNLATVKEAITGKPNNVPPPKKKRPEARVKVRQGNKAAIKLFEF